MQRTIKSFVLRAGRISQRQQQALAQSRSKFEISTENTLLDLQKLFGREGDTIVEIGFGMGKSLSVMALAAPEKNFIGIEVHLPGIGALAADLEEQSITNVKIINQDAVEIFKSCFMDESLAGVQIFFPDPWPKKRHHKRRLIQPEFLQLLVKKLKIGGFIHCATDWEDYAHHMQQVLDQNPNLKNQNREGGFIPRPESRPLTKFEQRGQRLGHGVWDLMYLRQK